MTILFAGSELDVLLPSDSSVIETASGTRYDSNFCRCAVVTSGQSAYVEATPNSDDSDIWYAFEVVEPYAQTNTNQFQQAVFYDDGGDPVFRLKTSPFGQTARLEHWDGAVWTLVGGEISVNPQVRQRYDVHIVANSASGYCDVYIGSTKRIESGTVDLSGVTAMSHMRGYGFTTLISENRYWSQFLIQDVTTIGKKVGTGVMTGNGASTTWTGDYTAIDELATSDGDSISSATNDQVELYTATFVSSFTGYGLDAVVVGARAKKSGSGPQQMQGALRSGGSNYFSSTKALDFGYTGNCFVWEQDPSGPDAWTSADLAGLQFGAKSIT